MSVSRFYHANKLNKLNYSPFTFSCLTCYFFDLTDHASAKPQPHINRHVEDTHTYTHTSAYTHTHTCTHTHAHAHNGNSELRLLFCWLFRTSHSYNFASSLRLGFFWTDLHDMIEDCKDEGLSIQTIRALAEGQWNCFKLQSKLLFQVHLSANSLFDY